MSGVLTIMPLSQSEKELAMQLNFAEDVLLMLKEAVPIELQKIAIERAIPESEREHFYLDEQAFCGRVIPQQEILEYQGHVTKLIVEGVSAIANLSKITELVTNLQAPLLEGG